MNHFTSQEKLKKHKLICVSTNECAIEMPTPGNNYETFKNFKNEIKAPFIIYADTETLLEQPEKSVFNADCSAQVHHDHEVHSIGYYFKHNIDESKSRYASHRGANCLDWFKDELTKIANEAFDFLKDKKTMNKKEHFIMKFFVTYAKKVPMIIH